MAEMARSEVTSSVLLVAGSWLDARFDDECVGNRWKLDRRARRLCGESWNRPIACGLKWASIEEHPAAEQGRRCDEIELRWRLAVRKCQRCWMTPVEVEREKRRAGAVAPAGGADAQPRRRVPQLGSADATAPQAGPEERRAHQAVPEERRPVIRVWLERRVVDQPVVTAGQRLADEDREPVLG